ncbi:MAG: metal-dependent transcriptional regulator [Planctomycetaceae bacterium]|nr:metal-dependent transcriptional regulator [Planctomycetaceae bacterium]
MPSLTVENYIKAIYQISEQQDKKPVTTGQLASTLGVAPGTVTSMLKTLNTAGLAMHTPYEGVSLSRTGQVLALRMIRRHRLIEQFLVQTLSMNWDEVHDEAEHMEHAVSDLLVDRIDEYLGRPEVDPHGDPIPRGTTDSDSEHINKYQPLSTLPMGVSFRVTRVLDQSPVFLRYLAETGLILGSSGHVEETKSPTGVFYVRVNNAMVALAIDAASNLLVEELASP